MPSRPPHLFCTVTLDGLKHHHLKVLDLLIGPRHDTAPFLTSIAPLRTVACGTEEEQPQSTPQASSKPNDNTRPRPLVRNGLFLPSPFTGMEDLENFLGCLNCGRLAGLPRPRGPKRHSSLRLTYVRTGHDMV